MRVVGLVCCVGIWLLGLGFVLVIRLLVYVFVCLVLWCRECCVDRGCFCLVICYGWRCSIVVC